MNDDNAPRFTPAELEKIVFGLNDRLLVVESRLGMPMSVIDKMVVEDITRRREEAKAAETRRNEAFYAARAEAEKAGDRGPLDAFTRRLNAGEFEPKPPRANGG
jgi:hypothetical protein